MRKACQATPRSREEAARLQTRKKLTRALPERVREEQQKMELEGWGACPEVESAFITTAMGAIEEF